MQFSRNKGITGEKAEQNPCVIVKAVNFCNGTASSIVNRDLSRLFCSQRVGMSARMPQETRMAQPKLVPGSRAAPCPVARASETAVSIEARGERKIILTGQG